MDDQKAGHLYVIQLTSSNISETLQDCDIITMDRKLHVHC